MDLFTVDTVGDRNQENEDSTISYSYGATKKHGDNSECSDRDDDDDDEAEEIVENETANVDNTSNDDEEEEEEYNFELYGGEKRKRIFFGKMYMAKYHFFLVSFH